MLEGTIERGKRCGKPALPDSQFWKGLGWADILKKHNDEFNLAGIVRNEQAAESSVEEPPVCSNQFVFLKIVVSHLRLRGQDEAAETLASDLQADALTGMGRCQVTGVATHEFLVDQEGKVYIKGLADNTLFLDPSS